MVFSSITFLILFLPLTLLAYYYWPGIRGRNRLLLGASLLFYAWGEPVYVLLMAASILVNYRLGLLLGDADRGGGARKAILALGVAANLLALVYFKYAGFFLGLLGVEAAVPALPIGISFYTFQSVSYLVDVYRDRDLAQRSLADLGLFIAFFPQLIAGPILRYHDVNRQIAEREHSAEKFAAGAERFIMGLGKKALLANTFAETADGLFACFSGATPAAAPALPAPYAWIAILAYTLQIYYDFSGYSDMAIGLGKMFGFEFPENFDHPYASASMTEFWRRWHISLSRWFRDYLYIPLGGSRRGRPRTYLNLYIVFLATGLWHGAAMNFVVWGLGHGTLLFLERLFRKSAAPPGEAAAPVVGAGGLVKRAAGRVYTLVSVTLLWVFFRLDLPESLRFFPALFHPGAAAPGNAELALLVDTRFWLFFAAGAALAFPWRLPRPRLTAAPWLPQAARYAMLLGCLVLSLCSLAGGAYNPFIYFRF